ncbi:DUF3987 domain-containing protein [Streptomyces sp. V4-01]|uniref:DUF3987 domain-containing protein n=1 Tax=Actinacidiphila polyblastidii TaxID=3110430 RepID=A0ABU7P8T7_9ACTN|nr:DUF3987 domain-containing protein [Streptomyces sp. V4-01]
MELVFFRQGLSGVTKRSSVRSAGKLAGATACMAALLHLAEHGGNGYAHPVTEATMRAAIELGDYYTAHALAVFDVMGADPVLSRARSVLEALRDNGWQDVSRRDVFSVLSRSEVPTIADLEPALALLEDHGYLRSYQPERTGRRGRPPRHPVSPPTRPCTTAAGDPADPHNPSRTNRKIRRNTRPPR